MSRLACVATTQKLCDTFGVKLNEMPRMPRMTLYDCATCDKSYMLKDINFIIYFWTRNSYIEYARMKEDGDRLYGSDGCFCEEHINNAIKSCLYHGLDIVPYDFFIKHAANVFKKYGIYHNGILGIPSLKDHFCISKLVRRKL